MFFGVSAWGTVLGLYARPSDGAANTRKGFKAYSVFAHSLIQLFGKMLWRLATPEKSSRVLVLLTAIAAGSVAAACTDQTANATTDTTTVREVPSLTQGSLPVRVAGERSAITGVRVTQGDAVDCPKIRDDAGLDHPVSYLSPAVTIGTRVSVSGFYAITTTCRGTVLVVEDEHILEN